MRALVDSNCIPNQKQKQQQKQQSKQSVLAIANRMAALESNLSKTERALAKKGAKTRAKAKTGRTLAGPLMVRDANSLARAFGLSHCAAKYALAIFDPWNPDSQGACIPRHPSRPSQKITLFSKTQVQFGQAAYSTGNTNATIGAIFMTPSLASDAPTMFYTPNSPSYLPITSLPSDSDIFTYSLPWLTPIYGNAPYSASQMTETGSNSGGSPQASGRIVSHGVSISYKGVTFNEGGIYTMFVSPNHDNMLNYAPSALAGYDETLTNTISRSTEWLNVSGIDETELVYTLNVPLDVAGTPYVTPVVYPYANSQVWSSNAYGGPKWGGPTSGGSAPTARTVAGTVTSFSGTLAAAATTASTTLTITLPSTAPSFECFASTGSVILWPAGTAAGNPFGGSSTIDSTNKPYLVPFSAATVSSSTLTLTIAAGAVTGSVAIGAAVGAGTGGKVGFAVGGACGAIYIQPQSANSPAVSSLFQVDFVTHVEYTGPITSALHTRTHSDARGCEAVMSAAQQVYAKKAADPTKSGFVAGLEALGDVVADLATPGSRVQKIASVAGAAYSYAKGMYLSPGDRMTSGQRLLLN